MTRQAYVHHPSKTLLYWAYKAANTSIVHGLAFDALGLPEDGRDPRPALDPILVGFARARLLSNNRGYRSIALIRDPYDRLVSSFLHIFVANRGDSIETLDQLELSGRAGYAALSGGASEYRGVVFRDFIHYCVEAIRHREGEPELDGHWNTQIPFAYLDPPFYYEYLFHTGQASAYFMRLSDLIGVPIRERRENSQIRTAGTPTSLVDICSLEYCRDPSVRHAANFQDDALRAAVEEAYTPDMHYFRMACASDETHLPGA